MNFRKATEADIPAVVRVYDSVHDAEERGLTTTYWTRGVYPTEATARASLARDDLFVAEDAGQVVGTAIINQQQVDVYVHGAWRWSAPDSQVMVLHTLVIDAGLHGRGYGPAFVRFYEEYALAHGCPYLRIDTGEINHRARAMYKKLGFTEVGVVPCVFNGIEGVHLVLLEKKLEDGKAQA